MRWLGLLLIGMLLPPQEDAKQLRRLIRDHIRGKDVREKLDKFSDWSLSDIREALAPGVAPIPEAPGSILEEFDANEETWSYRITVPEAALKGKPLPAVIDPGTLADENSWMAKKGAGDFFVIRTKIFEKLGEKRYTKLTGTPGRERNGHGFIDSVFRVLMRDLLGRYRIDPDRICIAGYSQAGYWAWHFGSVFNDRFAGVAPFSSAVWHVRNFSANFKTVPVRIVHADLDQLIPVEKVRQFHDHLRDKGYPARYTEVEGRHQDSLGNWRQTRTWLAEQRRDPYPKSFEKKLHSRTDRSVYWLEAKSITGRHDDPKRPLAAVAAKVTRNRIHIVTDGVKRLRIWLNDEIVKFDRPVEIVVNTKKVFMGRLKHDFGAVLARLRETGDTRALYNWKLDVEITE